MSSTPIAIRDLALMPGLFAAHAPAMISSAHTPPSAALLEYSRVARELLRQWWHCLQTPKSAAAPAMLTALAEEVLVTELTARVVAGVFAICDARTGRRAAGPFARSALLDLIQAKHWVLSRIVKGPQPLGAYLRINQLRRKTERWCDCLLAALPDNHTAVAFAVDADRVREFDRTPTAGASQAGQYLTLVSLRLAMPASLIQDPQRCETYRSLMRSLMAFWPEEAFDSHGLLGGPLWQRLRGLTDLPAKPEQWMPQRVCDLEVVHHRVRPSIRLFNDRRRR